MINLENNNNIERDSYIKIPIDNKDKLINAFKTSIKSNSIQELMRNLGVANYNFLHKKSVFEEIGNIYKNTLFPVMTPNLIKTMTNPFSELIKRLAEEQKKLVQSMMTTVFNNDALRNLSKIIDEAKRNPNSIYSWMNYYDKMSEFYWVMPYKMTAEELYNILLTIKDEREFDKYAAKYFNKEKVCQLINDIKMLGLKRQDLLLFNQIILSYNNKAYALSNVGLISIIDKLLSFYLINKGCTSRVGIFEPIIHQISRERENSDDFTYILMMLSSSINLLYEDINFNKRIVIKTNKKSRRNPTSHGKSYSNKKIDTIMLLNIVYYLLIIQKELNNYEGSLCRDNKKGFYFPEKKEKIKIKKVIKNKK